MGSSWSLKFFWSVEHLKIKTNITFQRLTLDQIQVVGLLQNAAFEATNQALEITTINIEQSLQNHFDSRIPLSLSYELFEFSLKSELRRLAEADFVRTDHSANSIGISPAIRN